MYLFLYFSKAIFVGLHTPVRGFTTTGKTGQNGVVPDFEYVYSLPWRMLAHSRSPTKRRRLACPSGGRGDHVHAESAVLQGRRAHAYSSIDALSTVCVCVFSSSLLVSRSEKQRQAWSDLSGDALASIRYTSRMCWRLSTLLRWSTYTFRCVAVC